jgi:hypothetical protein
MSFIIASILFWFLFASAMTLYDKWKVQKKYSLKWWGLGIVGLPIFIIGFPYDIIYNFTWGSLIFLELPKKRPKGKGFNSFEWTFTHRLWRLIYDKGWRGHVARFICRYLVQPWDLNHCGVQLR